MADSKTIVIYEGKDPYQSGVTFIAIQTETQPPYVFATYFTFYRKDLPDLPKDMLIVPVNQAKKLFDFKKGTLADLVSLPIRATMKINPDLKSRVDHCYALAENGATELAQAGLKLSIKQFCAEPHKQSFGNPELILQSIERTSHRVGVEVAFQYAKHFYQEGIKNAAREWLYYAKMHAKPLKLDITNRISEMKGKYRDRKPLLFL